MFDYRKNKERFIPNNLGSLYIDKSKLAGSEVPIIYIGGQMEQRFHIIEQTGYTFDSGHNMFAGSWFYDYPLFGIDKSKVNAHNMADNLLEALRLAHIDEVNIVTESFGGMIAAYASKSHQIQNIYAIHPPILGTPLANPSCLDEYKGLFNNYELSLLKMLKIIVDPKYGFEKDNYNGININEVDLKKILVIGSFIDPTLEKNKMVKGLYDMLLKAYRLRSDGVVIFDSKKFDELGINHVDDTTSYNHIEAGSEKYLNDFKEHYIKK